MPPPWRSCIPTAGSASAFSPPCRLRGRSSTPHARPFPLLPLIGYTAATLTTVSFVPQALKTLRSGDTRGISLRMYLLFCSGIVLWGLYGLLSADGPLIAANAITLVLSGLILERTWRTRRHHL